MGLVGLAGVDCEYRVAGGTKCGLAPVTLEALGGGAPP